MDYSRYTVRFWENVGCILAGTGITGAIAWLFYRSFWAMLLLPFTVFMCRSLYRKEQVKRRKERLLGEFKDAMQTISGALLAGYSMENAWREAEAELKKLHGEDSLMYSEVHRMNRAVSLNEPLERLLMEFAVRSGCEEIESFAEIFAFAKRSGGDFAKIIRTTVQKLTGKMEVEREIATVLSGRRLEGRIMCAMPGMILGYLTFSSGDFLDVLYGNLAGVLVMSAALGAYMGAMWLSEHILDIRV